ncbi:terminase small subunit [Paraburkholderia silviterrae]|uniref:Terminase small subunit n=1 Tax=Paraburkholderia silviterrae TaxID=2528715 RepID=A0A4R5ME26_9BURK|nr:terminase small subunit [Paraburkholderia silviterrae]TDG25352.1 terminase small subunit [Paraburkholderia silviterrae]
MALTGKKRAFADAVLAGKSNKEAAIEAGCSPKTASAAGSRLAKDKDVVAYIEQRGKKGAAKAELPSSLPQDDERAAMTRAAVDAGFDLGAILTFKDPRDFLLAAMNDPETEKKLRVTAAQTLMPFFHQKLGEGGKKDAKAEAAKKAASKFGSLAPPKLVVNNRK